MGGGGGVGGLGDRAFLHIFFIHSFIHSFFLSFFCRPISSLGPQDAYSVQLDTSGPLELVRWTRSEVGGLDSSTFVAPGACNVTDNDNREKKMMVT